MSINKKIDIKSLHDENKYIFDNIDDNNYYKLLSSHIKNIFRYNNFNVSDKYIKINFNNLIEFIYNNIVDEVIKSIYDLKYYVINELNLTISNNQYCFKRFFKSNYNYMINESNYKIVCYD